MTHTIYIFENTLSDGSYTYDVQFNNLGEHGVAPIHAVTFEDALKIAETFQGAILRWSNDDVRIVSREMGTRWFTELADMPF